MPLIEATMFSLQRQRAVHAHCSDQFIFIMRMIFIRQESTYCDGYWQHGKSWTTVQGGMKRITKVQCFDHKDVMNSSWPEEALFSNICG